jgi:asparagine synthase (glutamine-hydrolysing)
LAKNKKGEGQLDTITSAIHLMSHRGPDNQECKIHSKGALAHARLSIIDVSSAANQPMVDKTGRYELVFNGEIYNYLVLKSDLEGKGVHFETESDTEVLLHLLIQYGKLAIEKLNGFFAFIFYDKQEDIYLIARDRMGIKPLLVYEDDDKIIISSELTPILEFDIDKTIDKKGLNEFFRLTYIPAPNTIFEKVKKVQAGTILIIRENKIERASYHELQKQSPTPLSFEEAKVELKNKLCKSVQDRLVSDVPLGSFLSGGVDSSVVAAIAAKSKSILNTFSIGFDHEFFNESTYANKVAIHIGSKHHEFVIGKKEFRDNFHDYLNAIDEPFADSSGFAVYLLSEKTKQEVSVALSGDGADELFGGYRKHLAENQIRSSSGLKKGVINIGAGLLKGSGSSRSNRIGDINRKLQKFNKGLKLSNEERYWEWCSFSSDTDVQRLLKPELITSTSWTGKAIEDINDLLLSDQGFILPNDMLKKVDLMSMAHSLEVRTPFLDKNIVEFANSLPESYKLNKQEGKLILKAAFEEDLPKEILYRSKKGFEVPIQDWLSDEIEELFNSEMFSKDYIERQGLFNHNYIALLGKNLKNSDFGDKIYLVWSLLVFQYWWNKHMIE